MTDTATIIDPQPSPKGDTVDEFSAAVRKAVSWDVAFRPTNAGAFHERVLGRRRELIKLERELTSLPPSEPNDAPRMILSLIHI